MSTKIISILVVSILVAAGVGTAAYIILDDNNSNSKTIDVNLEIYGNADKDNEISSDDADLIDKYLDAIDSNNESLSSEIKSKMSMTFADANCDGTIDRADSAQVRAILDRNAQYIWMLDGIGEERKVSLDISKIGCEYFSNTELCLILGLSDKITAVDNAPYQYADFYFTAEQQSNITNMYNCNNPDYDMINGLNLDTYLVFSGTASYDTKQEKIIDCDVLYLGLYNPDLTNTGKSSFVQGVLKAGYIFNAVDRAENYIDWLLDYRDDMLTIANSISDENKPTVCMSNYTSNQYFMDGSKGSSQTSIYRTNDPLGQAITLAGGKNILDSLSDSSFVTSGAYSVKVQIDSILNDDPNIDVDYIFLHMVKYTYGGTINKNVPDHGYTTDDYAEIKEAYNVASGQSLVKDESITLIAGDFRNGCTGGVLLAAYMGNVINPGEYSSIDPIKMHNEYVAWMGITGYNVADNGVFVYPYGE